MKDLNIHITKSPIKRSADVTTLNSNDFTNPYSPLLRNLNEYSLEQHSVYFDKIVDSLKWFPALAKVLDNISETGNNYEVVFPKGVLEKIKSGEYTLSKSSKAADEFVSFVKDKKTNQIVAQLRVKDVSEIADIEKWNDITSSLQNMAVMQQLSTITKMLESIEMQLTQVVQEFNNDRIGKIQSGYSDYLNALQMNDPQTKKITLCNAYSKLSEGREQLIESTKKYVDELSKTKTGIWASIFYQFFSRNFQKDQKKRANEIAVNLFYIQRATQVILAIKQELNEPQAMLQSLAPYNDIISYISNPTYITSLSEWKNDLNWERFVTEILSSIDVIPEFRTIKNSDYVLKLDSN
jgi:hypothetical protein